MSNKTHDLYEFGDFRIDLNERVLYKNEKLVQLAPKVFETLLMLVENNGKILSKDDLMETIWKDSFVEEGNLTQNIYTLRQIFGKRNKFIKTVPRRGYRFDAEINLLENGNGLVSQERTGQIADSKELSEVVVARRTKTTILSEEIVEEDDGKFGEAEVIETKLLAEGDQGEPFLNSHRFQIGLGIGAVIAILLSTLGFLIWQRNFGAPANSLLDRVTFAALTDTGDVQNFAISPNGQILAIVKNDSDNGTSIILKDINSKEELPLNIPKEFQPRSLEFSPDGNSIYFLNRRDSIKGAEIHKTSRFGGATEYISGDVWSEFAFSPSGKKIAFYRKKSAENRFQLIVLNIAEKSEKVLVTKDFPKGFDTRSSPAWSPDETEIFAISRFQARPFSNLLKISVESGKESIIDTPQVKQFTSIAAMPNGEDLVFGAREKDKFPQIYKVNKSGGKILRLTNDLNVYRKIALSRDGKSLVALQKLNFSHIWLLPDRDPVNAVQLTIGKYNRDGKHGIDVLPNGKTIYTSLEDLNRNLWAIDSLSKSKQQLTKDISEINERPFASSDGKFIYFSSLVGRTFRIMRIDAQGQNLSTLTEKNTVSDLFPNVSKDGEILYFIRQEKGKSSLIRKNLSGGTESEIKIPKDFSPDSFLALSPDGNFLAFREGDRMKRNELEEEASNPVNISIVATDGDISKAKQIRVTTSQSQFRWNPTGDAICYIEHKGDSSTIKMKSILDDSEPQQIVEIPETRIYHFQWMNENDLVVSQGRTRDDAVLIKNFD